LKKIKAADPVAQIGGLESVSPMEWAGGR